VPCRGVHYILYKEVQSRHCDKFSVPNPLTKVFNQNETTQNGFVCGPNFKNMRRIKKINIITTDVVLRQNRERRVRNFWSTNFFLFRCICTVFPSQAQGYTLIRWVWVSKQSRDHVPLAFRQKRCWLHYFSPASAQAAATQA
jgi:hypothetical protein